MTNDENRQAALAEAANRAEDNPVGALRLVAWAVRREAPFAGDLRFEQGPAAWRAIVAPSDVGTNLSQPIALTALYAQAKVHT